jgi:Aromatic amino acid lyase
MISGTRRAGADQRLPVRCRPRRRRSPRRTRPSARRLRRACAVGRGLPGAPRRVRSGPGELWGDEHEARALGELAERLNPESRRRTHQGPVSFRIHPRVLGQAERSLHLAEQAAAASLRSVTDNPVYLLQSTEHPDGRVLSTGGYHNAAAPAALHQLAVTWADLCQVAERHIGEARLPRRPRLRCRRTRSAAADDRGRLLGGCTLGSSTGHPPARRTG